MTSAIKTLPFFTLSTTHNKGLDLLTTTTMKVSTGRTTLPPPFPNPPFHTPGPFNQTVSLPTKLVKRILELEFIEMADITMDETPLTEPGCPPA